MLGPGYLVEVFPRATVSLDPDSGRWVGVSDQYLLARRWEPQIVVVAIGASDLVGAANRNIDRLSPGVAKLCELLDTLPGPPQVVLCTPPPAAPGWRRAQPFEAGANLLEQTIKAEAARRKLAVADVRTALRGSESSLVDGCVPTGESAQRYARCVAEAITGKPVPAGIGLYRPSEPPQGLETIEVVRDGVAVQARGAEKWKTVDGALVGEGPTSALFAATGVGNGRFRVRMRLAIEAGEGAAAQVGLDGDWFLFENKQENVSCDGVLFRGRPVLGPSKDFWTRGKWIDFEVRRAGQEIEYFIDGTLAYAVPCPVAAYDRIGINPMNSTVRLSSFTVEREPAGLADSERILGVPMVDLSPRADLRTVVGREPGQYLGHPSTLLLEDGKTILCAYPRGHGKGAIVLKRSEDGGATWSPPLPTPENWATSLETPTLHRLVDPKDGSKRIVLFSGLFPARRAVSSDDGRTWTPLEKVGDWGGIVVMSSVIATPDGKAIAFFHDDGRFLRAGGRFTGRSTVYSSTSTDGGQTWGEPKALLSDPEAFLCEPGVLRSPDGKRLAMLLRENNRKRNSFISFSDDQGSTWSPPRELPASLTGDRHVGVRLADGRYVVSMRDMAKDSPTYGDWVAWVGTWEDLEAGRPGQCRVRLMDNFDGTDCGYAGLELLPDQTIVATSYGHWVAGEQPYVVSLRIPARELPVK